VSIKAGALAVAVAGADGRMGRMLIEAVLRSDDLRLAGALDVATSLAVGQDAATFLGSTSGVRVTPDLERGLAGAQVLIDFTRPAGTLAHVDACRERGVAMVIGTTGFSAEDKARIVDAATAIPIVMAPNMSVGVNVMLQLLAQAARALGDGYDVEIVEAHHRHKVDAPSGTALAMGEAVARFASAVPLGASTLWRWRGRRAAASPTSRSTPAKDTPASGAPARSASPASAAGTSSASTA
jgi:4-hydroxy-tetrahydrodipicolinate reductase